MEKNIEIFRDIIRKSGRIGVRINWFREVTVAVDPDTITAGGDSV